MTGAPICVECKQPIAAGRLYFRGLVADEPVHAEHVVDREARAAIAPDRLRSLAHDLRSNAAYAVFTSPYKLHDVAKALDRAATVVEVLRAIADFADDDSEAMRKLARAALDESERSHNTNDTERSHLAPAP